MRRRLIIAVPILLIAAYAAVLRLQAITDMYGLAAHPGWVQAAQSVVDRSRGWLMPASMRWEPAALYPHRDGPPTRYFGDPYTYLEFARAMTWPFAAHRREPGYPLLTKIMLWLFGNQDVAVSFGSSLCGVLVVLVTYRVGLSIAPRSVAIAAALAMAIDYDAVTWSALGGRDDLFTLTVLAFAWLLVRYLKRPSLEGAIVLGLGAGISCLVRLSALSFALPILAALAAAPRGPWRARIGHAALAAGVMTIVFAPYVINCWRAYGRPFYALDTPAAVYEVAEGAGAGPTAASYVRDKLLARPMQTIDTVAVGLTSYPFTNKWTGLNHWVPSIGWWLSAASLAGLFLWLFTANGRWMLALLATSLIPYSVTWKLSAEWRLTEVAYPFYLLAAFAAADVAAYVARPSRVRALIGDWRSLRKPLIAAGAALAFVAAAAYAVLRVLPTLTERESLAAGDEVTIAAGDRDRAFFRSGWTPPFGNEAVQQRAAPAGAADLSVVLPRAADYDATLRVDPYPRPSGDALNGPRTVLVSLNGTVVARLALQWNPQRVGSYKVRLPQASVKTGTNDLAFWSDDGGFSVWYVRLYPPAR